jgi:hypothetical protein
MKPTLSQRASAFVIVTVALSSGCASHAPTADCDKGLAPINVGETLKPATVHKDTPSARGVKP